MNLFADRLVGKVALITGAASGIGECTTKLFAKHGAKIVIADIQDELGQAVCDAIGSSNSIYVHCDITKEEDVKNAIDTAITTYGKLDIMFNNAGIIDSNKPHIFDNEKADFERSYGPVKAGSIISTASVASNIGGISTHAHCSAKHAVVGLTKNLAVELGQFGIRVNCLSPHGIATPFSTKNFKLEADANVEEVVENVIHLTGNLKGVKLKTDDIANAALFLASDEAKYISGQNLFIDGGFSIVNPSLNNFNPASFIVLCFEG
ncbi:putative secoisolariciresinol dehydrogenase [Helianthus annuus]|nr:putative secoisolariciresinol dehydrogenase [Helianthus annuus]